MQLGMLQKRCMIFLPLISLTGRVFLRKACHARWQLGREPQVVILGLAWWASSMRQVGLASQVVLRRA